MVIMLIAPMCSMYVSPEIRTYEPKPDKALSH
jgi:hypothetical protein